MKATRRDVARAAGVSPAVVSYVANNGPRPVAAETRARVEAAIEALDYRPNAIANAFRDGRTHTVGLLAPSPLNPAHAELAHVVERALRARNLVLSLSITTFNAELDEARLRDFADRGVDGILVAASESLGRGARPSGSPPLVVLDALTDDTYDAARAVDHLLAHGHSRIGCIAGPQHWSVPSRRLDGWRLELRAAGLHAGGDLVAHTDVSTAGGARALHDLVADDSYRRSRRGERPSAVYVQSDIQALGALRACADLGIRVPEDLAVISHDGVAYGTAAVPRLSTLRPPRGALVEEALDRLVGDRPYDGEALLRGNLVVGDTCGCDPLGPRRGR